MSAWRKADACVILIPSLNRTSCRLTPLATVAVVESHTSCKTNNKNNKRWASVQKPAGLISIYAPETCPLSFLVLVKRVGIVVKCVECSVTVEQEREVKKKNSEKSNEPCRGTRELAPTLGVYSGN